MTRPFRLLPLESRTPAQNLAVDDALLVRGGDVPVLRLYTWEPAALSLGYFQKLEDVPAAHMPGLEVVRRFTGGGAIHHAHELTFSIAAPASDPLYRGPVADSYCRVHALLEGALAEFGVASALRCDQALASDRTGTGMCFHGSTAQDLVWTGTDGERRKGVGSAQRRSGGRVLHHGSIKLAPDPLEPGAATVGGGSAVEDGGAGTARPIAAAEFASRLVAAFERGLDTRLEPSELTEREREHVLDLGDFFADPRFLADRRYRPEASDGGTSPAS
ncbi:Octanoyltransferase LipM [Planctomycetes bacterium Pla163]|uniref:Octanoyltransferase LipM n=1 Tax=Rohdeia mirabilis TaxID=2528008 RepID=A0A518CYV5_9BACT|nr:Octanoyltransferase LipM [Planctomycetes bacterium Pla163]